MKIRMLTCFVVLLAMSVSFADPPPALRTGVVQFEIKNDIGLENAGVIIPEILASYLKEFSQFTLIERVLLSKVFEEHELQLSGAIDEKMAVQMGQIFGVEALVSGSAMKIGKTISIAGRMIDTRTGEILASGTVAFTDINTVELYLEELANLLAGVSKDELNRRRVAHELSKSKYGARLGAGFAQTQGGSGGMAGMLIGLYGQTKYLDAEFSGIAPVLGRAPLIAALMNVNPFTHFGFGAGYLFASDELDTAEPSRKSAQYHSLVLGLNIRATAALRGGIYLGPALASSIGVSDYIGGVKDLLANYKGGFSLGDPIPPAILMDLEYSFTKNLSARLMFVMNGTGGDIELDETGSDPDPLPNNSMSTSYFILSVGYSFSL